MEERISNIFILGPDFINEIYQYTPSMFRFMLGAPPKNLLKAAGFVSQHLCWFLKRNPVEYKQVLGPIIAILFLVVYVLTMLLFELAGYLQTYLSLSGGAFNALSLSLVFCLGIYYIYLLERQVIALKRVAEIIRGLASSE